MPVIAESYITEINVGLNYIAKWKLSERGKECFLHACLFEDVTNAVRTRTE